MVNGEKTGGSILGETWGQDGRFRSRVDRLTFTHSANYKGNILQGRSGLYLFPFNQVGYTIHLFQIFVMRWGGEAVF